jgi:hypothetical protein
MPLYSNYIPSSSIDTGKHNPKLTAFVYTHIPSSHLNMQKTSQIVPEQMINETVELYADAVPYIRCMIKSTIQHEAGHRKDEQGRFEAKERGTSTQNFEAFSNEGRSEPIAEQEEEDCQMPTELSSHTISVSLYGLFEEAKAESSLPEEYKKDVKAGTLAPEAQGMYLMQDLPIVAGEGSDWHTYKGFDGSLWVDVRKIVQPFIATQASHSNTNQEVHPATFQDDGVTRDTPGVSNVPPVAGAVPASGSVSAVPAIPGRGAR